MSSDPSRPAPAELVGELARTLRSLRRELRAESVRGGRGLERLVAFTSEVTIPATILVLETNVRALRLLQRSLRLARDADEPAPSRDVLAQGGAVVGRIDDALGEVQTAVENASAGEETRNLLAEARDLNRQLESRLEDLDEEETTASVDVESELASLQDEYGDREEGDGDEGPDGT